MIKLPITIPSGRKVVVPGSIKTSYGQIGQFSIFIKDSTYGEKDFTLYLEFPRCSLELKRKDFLEFLLVGLDDTDLTNYVKAGNTYKFFVNNKLLLKGRIEEVNAQNNSMEALNRGFGMEIILSDRYTDQSTYTFTNSSNVTIVVDFCNGIIDIGENDNIGTLTGTWSFDNHLDALSQVSDYLDSEWWVSQDFPYDTDKFNFKKRRGSIPIVKYFYDNGDNANIFNCVKILDKESFINSIILTGSNNDPNTEFSAVSTIYSTLFVDTMTPVEGTDLKPELVSSKDFPDTGILKIGNDYISFNRGGSITDQILGAYPNTESTTSNKHFKDVLVFLSFNGTDSERTQLNGNITSTDTTITVDSTSLFNASGNIIIGNEKITYTSVTATTFTGCTRGSNADAHTDEEQVFEYSSSRHYTKDTPQTSSSIQTWELREYKLEDLNLTNISTTEVYASSLLQPSLEKNVLTEGALITAEFFCADPFDIIEDIMIGDTIYVSATESGLNQIFEIIKIEIGESKEIGEYLKISAGDRKKLFVDTLFGKLVQKYG